MLIRQFSNGKRNLAGFPFNFITTTHYVVKAGVSFPSINPFPLTSMNPSLERMWVDYRNPKCIVDSVKDMGDDEPIYRDYLRQHGVEKLVACPIVSLQSYPVGLIGIGFIDANDQTLSDEEMVARTQVVAVRVAGYLGSISNAEIKPWWKVW